MTQEPPAPEQEVAESVENEQRVELSDLQDMVDDMIVYLHEAKNVPLSGNALVDREKFLGMLEKIRADLPDELRAARWMVREREAFVSRTNEKARDMVDRARKEADEQVSGSNIVAEAVEEANILVRRAEGEARRLRLETEDEIERRLQRVEVILNEMMAQIQNARDELHEARPKPPDVPV